ncbi:hypothetical protein [Kaarinaea lacus]
MAKSVDVVENMALDGIVCTIRLPPPVRLRWLEQQIMVTEIVTLVLTHHE